MTDLPIVMGPQGRVNTSPADLLATLIVLVSAQVPGYTANLPGSLIEDISSTDVGALVTMDQALTDLINSLTPYGANEFLLNQLGQIYDVQQGGITNTSVYVVFSGSVSFAVPKGFVVSDGTHQYVVQDGGIIASGGSTDPLYCVATVAGTWSVGANTVTTLATGIPSSVTLSVTNPTAGTPGAAAQSEESYRAVVLQAGRAASQGMATFLRTLLVQVSGVQPRLIAVQQQSPGWKVIVGGGDPYQVAFAIFTALFDISILVGSTTTIRNVTVSINDFPDSYTVIFVNPPEQDVAINLTWNTISPNYVSDSAVAAAAIPALADYVNSVDVGQPINLFELEEVFQASVANIIPPAFLTRMVFEVYIATVLTPPVSGTGVIAGDPESYFLTNSGAITVVRG